MSDFPDTYETKTTTTTTTSSTTVCTYNEGYLRSVPGLLRVFQIVVGLIYWITTAITCSFYRGYLIPVTVFAWILTILLFVLFLFMVVEKITFINWPLTEFLNNVIWGVLHLVGVIFVVISLSNGCSHWFGAWVQLFLAIGITLLYAFHAFLGIQMGVVTFRTQSSGGTVQT